MIDISLLVFITYIVMAITVIVGIILLDKYR